MTDATGIVEHAVFVVPNYPEGYSTDDNARALIVAILLEQVGVGAPPGSADLASRYMAFLWLAFDQTTRDSEIVWATIASGKSPRDQKTVMAGHFGDWGPYSASPRTKD